MCDSKFREVVSVQLLTLQPPLLVLPRADASRTRAHKARLRVRGLASAQTRARVLMHNCVRESNAQLCGRSSSERTMCGDAVARGCTMRVGMCGAAASRVRKMRGSARA